MIALEMRNLGGGEILHACPQESLDKPLPCIVFYHGFTSSKLVYSYFAVALAEAGFRVIMPDAPEHGARYQGDEAGRMQRFWPILQQNFREFPALREAIIAEGWLEGERLAVAGASMGGMTALGIMTHHPELNSVACLMGSGYFRSLSQTLFPRLILMSIASTNGMSAISWRPLPGGRYCSGMAMPMTWCRRKKPFD
ncbi:esterase [Klebsiella pneumoniae]|uniref:Esterase n=1 Tax=Klebsiella pneumoniae TaxID=573 RepID=A0A377UU19_KLEPN|nr:esterase [Klebsiella pneumoniae]